MDGQILYKSSTLWIPWIWLNTKRTICPPVRQWDNDRWNNEGTYSVQRYQWGHQQPDINMCTNRWGHRVQKEELDYIREDKELDSIRQEKHKHNGARQNRNKGINKCKYCSSGHPQRQYSSYDKMCSSCGKANHFKAVCRSAQMQQQGQRLPKRGRSVHKVWQDEECCPL